MISTSHHQQCCLFYWMWSDLLAVLSLLSHPLNLSILALQSMSDCLFIACRDFVRSFANYTQTCNSDGIWIMCRQHCPLIRIFKSLDFTLFFQREAMDCSPSHTRWLSCYCFHWFLNQVLFLINTLLSWTSWLLLVCTAVVHCPNDKCFGEFNVCNFHY